MDEVDLANDLLDIQINKAIKKANMTKTVNETGKCWYCQEQVEDGRRWCDSDCRDLWEKRSGR